MIEVNAISPLFPDYGIYGGYVKIVGTSFRNEKTSLPRHVTIRGFFERNTSKSTYSGDLRGFISVVNVKDIEEVEDIQKDINRYIRIQRELDNPYDSNAIAVYVENSSLAIKIGYFPKDLAELIAEQKFRYYVVGFEKSGKGMMLTMIFVSKKIQDMKAKLAVLESNENESLGFMSLNKMRKRLCK